MRLWRSKIASSSFICFIILQIILSIIGMQFDVLFPLFVISGSLFLPVVILICGLEGIGYFEKKVRT